MRTALLFLLLLLPLATTQAADPATLVKEGYDQKEMDEAIAKAKKTVDKFIQVLESGEGENFAVKAPIKDGEDVEHFWITDVTFKKDKFTGRIGNDPGIVSNVEIGQKWTIAKDEISDWMFMRDSKMHGNYTMRPLLKTMPEEQAKALRSLLADPESESD